MRTVWIAIFLITASSAQAWNGAGHMTVAYIAYNNLNANTRARVDALLQLNPMSKQWIAGVPDNQKGLAGFLHAAEWPDCIKSPKECPGKYTDSDGLQGGDVPKNLPQAAQNIGYADLFMHKYWHFYDSPYSPNGVPTKDPSTPNAATQIPIFVNALSSNASDDVKSYDLAWLEHLIGDVHQPLHLVSRFTINFPGGDHGGNEVKFCSSVNCSENLHSYWDDLLGENKDLATISRLGNNLFKKGSPQRASETSVTVWIAESLALAKQYVYASPISNEDDPKNKVSPKPDKPYRSNAVSVAESQILLAGYRLAETLNRNLQ